MISMLTLKFAHVQNFKTNSFSRSKLKFVIKTDTKSNKWQRCFLKFIYNSWFYRSSMFSCTINYFHDICLILRLGHVHWNAIKKGTGSLGWKLFRQLFIKIKWVDEFHTFNTGLARLNLRFFNEANSSQILTRLLKNSVMWWLVSIEAKNCSAVIDQSGSVRVVAILPPEGLPLWSGVCKKMSIKISI